MGATTGLASNARQKATPLARITFAVWGLMTEIVGATLVVGMISVLAIAAVSLTLAI
jgi:hypothetical protein